MGIFDIFGDTELKNPSEGPDWRNLVPFNRIDIMPGSRGALIKDDSNRGDGGGGGLRDAASAIPSRDDLPGLLGVTPGGVAVADPYKLSKRWQEQYGVPTDVAGRLVLDEDHTNRTILDMIQEMHRYDSASIEALQQDLYRAGFYTSKPTINGRWDADTLSATINMFEEHSRSVAAGGQDTWKDFLGGAASQAEAEGGTGPTTKTTTSSTVTLSSSGDANAVLRSAMRSLLGRAPNSREVRRFKRELNAAERANPTLTTSTVEGSNDPNFGPTEKSRFTEGGIDEADMTTLATNEVNEENGVERNRFGVMDYMSAFEEAIGG